MCKIVESRCHSCGKHFFFERDAQAHRCPPKWQVWEDEGSERRWASNVFASDAQEAAEKFVEDHDAYGDYTCVGGSPMTVCVAADGEEKFDRYEVEGEAVPQYTARKIE